MTDNPICTYLNKKELIDLRKLKAQGTSASCLDLGPETKASGMLYLPALLPSMWAVLWGSLQDPSRSRLTTSQPQDQQKTASPCPPFLQALGLTLVGSPVHPVLPATVTPWWFCLSLLPAQPQQVPTPASLLCHNRTEGDPGAPLLTISPQNTPHYSSPCCKPPALAQGIFQTEKGSKQGQSSKKEVGNKTLHLQLPVFLPYPLPKSRLGTEVASGLSGNQASCSP